MDLRNCIICGQAFPSRRSDICPDCDAQEENEYKKVRDFIKDNPKTAIAVVAEATEVEEDRIREYLRAGRLDTADLSGPVLECTKCGKPIYRGQYCVLCQTEIASGLRSSAPSSAAPKQKGVSFTKKYRDGE